MNRLNKIHKRTISLYVFCGLLFIAGITGVLMQWISRDFIYTNGNSFSIFDLQIASDAGTLENRISAISPRVIQCVFNQTLVDFLFIASLYPAIALLCWLAGSRFDHPHATHIFRMMSVLMILPLGADVYENLQLINWLKYSSISSTWFLWYSVAVWIKFGVAILITIIALFTLLVSLLKSRFLR